MAADVSQSGERAAGPTAAAGAPVSAVQARRALLRWIRHRPGWVLTAIAAQSAAGLAAIAHAILLTAVLDAAFLRGRGLAAVATPLAWWLAVVAFRALSQGVGATASRRAADSVTRSLRQEVTRHLMALGPAYLERRPSGVIGAEVLDGVDRVGPLVSRFVPQLAVTALVPAAIAAFTLWLDPLSGVILLVTGPLIPFFMWLLGSLAEHRAQRQWRALGMLSAFALDAFRGLETLRLFGRERDHESAMASAGEHYRRTTLDVLRVAFLSGFALELLVMLGTAMVAVTVGIRLAQGSLAFTTALLTLLLAPEFYLPFRRLGAHHHAAMEGMAALRDVVASLDGGVGAAPPAEPIVNADQGLGLAHPTVAVAPAEASPAVRLAGVWAAYPERDEAALKGVDLALAPHSMTALVGPTGGGKSSIVKVLIGTLGIDSGHVHVDGRIVDPVHDPGWRSRLAYVPQHPHLFAGTVLDNLRLARPGAPMVDVVAAARRAEADGFIRELPDGYHTPLGEDGFGLSGGERHRLAIARAFLRRADVVVLDEISAYLDTATEAALMRAVERLAHGCTLLVIAHRLATVRRAHSIAVLVDGRLAEQGTHSELLARHGVYADLAAPTVAAREPLGAT